MPHASLQIVDGVNQNRTQALNQAGVSQSQLIRFKPNNRGGMMLEKRGGWSKFYANTTPAVVRALWAWEDTDAASHLAYGTQNIGLTGQAQLGVITGGSQKTITPRSQTANIAPAAVAISGNSIVTLTDAVTTNVTRYDAVYIATHIAIGGIVLFGLYPTDPDGHSGVTTYTVQALDLLGNPLAAGSSSSSPTLATFTTTNSSADTTVTLAGHGYSPGDTYPVLAQTTVGGITFFGNYIVQSVTSASAFVITGGNNASSGTTGTINGGNVRYIYSFGIGAIPAGTGYGIGGYGRGGYGTGTAVTPSLGNPIAAVDWTLDNWGQILISCPSSPVAAGTTPFEPIYQYDPTQGAPTATIIPQAPPVNEGVFVAMPERQLIAYGSTFTGIQDPLLIRWCDIDNYTVWIGDVENQAGSFRLAKGSKIVGGIQGPQQGLIWTDIDLWSMQYINQPFIYSFNEIGSGCGLIAKKAAGILGGSIYWMGPSQFFTLGSEGVVPLVCPVWDVIFQDLDQANLSKIRVAVNSLFGEIEWYYPTLTSNGEVAAYVKYNAILEQWDYGQLARSAWIDQSVVGPPVGADPNSLYIYQHETSTDADGQALNASFTTGYFALSEGEYKTFIDQFWPDFKYGYFDGMQNATINLTFYAVDYPGQTPRTYGPYTITQGTTFLTPRIRARLLAFQISSNDVGSFWRIGDNRYRFMPDGKF